MALKIPLHLKRASPLPSKRIALGWTTSRQEKDQPRPLGERGAPSHHPGQLQGGRQRRRIPLHLLLPSTLPREIFRRCHPTQGLHALNSQPLKPLKSHQLNSAWMFVLPAALTCATISKTPQGHPGGQQPQDHHPALLPYVIPLQDGMDLALLTRCP